MWYGFLFFGTLYTCSNWLNRTLFLLRLRFTASRLLNNQYIFIIIYGISILYYFTRLTHFEDHHTITFTKSLCTFQYCSVIAIRPSSIYSKPCAYLSQSLFLITRSVFKSSDDSFILSTIIRPLSQNISC